MKNNLFLFFCFLIAGCSSKVSQPESAEIVPYNGSDGSSLSTFIRSIEVVKPDHQQSITIGTFCVVRQEGDCFYIGDISGSKLIYRFDRQGHFLNSIGKTGRASGEYLQLDDFYIDPDTDELYVLSNPDGRLCRYRKNGEFIDQRNIPDRTGSFTKLGTDFWLYEGFNNGKYPERLLRVDSSLQIVGKYLPSDTKSLEPGIGPVFVSAPDEAYLFNAFESVVYRIMPDTVVPYLQFDYGPYNIPESYWKSEDCMQAFMDLNQKGFIYISAFMQNDDYILTEHTQQDALENYYICGVKERHRGKWNWSRQRVDEKGMIAAGPDSGKEADYPDWYARKLKGFTQDGKLMVFLLGYELVYLTPNDKQLIKNPELLENADPEMDMFIFLCTLKQPKQMR